MTNNWWYGVIIIINQKIIMQGRLRFVIILLFHVSTLVRAQGYIDSLETKLILVDNDRKLEILDEIIPYYFRNDPLEASKKAVKMLSLARQQDKREFEIKAQRYIGLSDAYLKSDHEIALKNCYEAELNAKTNGFIQELILTKLAIADIFTQNGNSTKALDYQLNAYHLSDSIGNTALNVIVLNSQARSYIVLKDYEKAELSLKKALKISKINDLHELIAETSMIFGDLYSDAFNHDLALHHYELAHEAYIKLKKDIDIAIALFKIGHSYLLLDQIEDSFNYHLLSLAIRNRIKDRRGLAESYNEIGLLCIENAEYQRAINNLRIGLANAEMINSNTLMQQSFDYLYQAYMGLKDFENAVLFQNKYIDISELIYAEASERAIQEIINKNEIDAREREIKNLELLNERKEKELSASRLFIFTLILLLAIVTVLILFTIRSYRNKKRTNKELQRINDMMTKQNEELRELNSTKDKFFSIIGHDLKSPLNSLTSFSQLLINHTASLTEEEIRTIARDLDKSLKNLYELLENLLGWAGSQTGRLEFLPENFNVSKVIRENIRLLSKAAMNKKIKLELIADETLEVYADINSIRTVIRNLLSNAIKFTHETGVISIYVDEWKDSIEIGIHDTGVGMTKEVMEKIFDISAKHTTLGTNKEKGTGLGLILCREFIERNQGKLNVESEPGHGSTFKFTLPKKKKTETVQLEEVNID
jgi:signal transduction histidine kinase